MIIKIEVTEQDIKNGRPVQAEYCPIALAMKRHCQYDRVSVCSFYAAISEDSHIELPEIVGQWVRDFDSGRPVKPFSFEIDTNNVKKEIWRRK